GLQRLGIRLEVTEAVLNHKSGSTAGIVGGYQRHDYADEKRDALARWADHVDALGGGTEANGVALRGGWWGLKFPMAQMGERSVAGSRRPVWILTILMTGPA